MKCYTEMHYCVGEFLKINKNKMHLKRKQQMNKCIAQQ